MTDLVEQAARRIATEMGDDFDHAFASKHEWTRDRGERGGRFRDINEPFQSYYLDAARAVIALVVKPYLEGWTAWATREIDETEFASQVAEALERAGVK